MALTLKSLSEDEIKDHVKVFAESVAENIQNSVDIELSIGEAIGGISKEQQFEQLTIFSYVTGTVQAIYTLSIPIEVACAMLEIDSDTVSIEDFSIGFFEEVLNMAVGRSIELLKSRFGFLSYNPPVLVLGDIVFPSYQNGYSLITSDIGDIKTEFMINMANLEITDKLLSTMKKLKHQQGLIYKDNLTGVYNRAYFEYYKNNLWGKRRPITIAMVDVDKFKDINDSYGHSVGDKALQLIASTITDVCRDNDIAIRFGGDEFVVILEDSPLIGGQRLFERIAKKLKETPLVVDKNRRHIITLSVGVAEHIQQECFESLFERADKALYRAKENGRDCIEVTGDA